MGIIRWTGEDVVESYIWFLLQNSFQYSEDNERKLYRTMLI